MKTALAHLGLAGIALASSLGAQAPELTPVSGAHVPTAEWASEVRSIRSDALDEELRLFVARPPSFERSSARRYPVLYLLDGQYYFPELQSVVAPLVASGQIPELVLIGIESRDRRVDFTPPGIYLDDVGDAARADRYLDFLEHELAPAAEATLRAGWPRVLLGHSHGGMLALHAVAARPAAFPWVVAVDGPTHHEQGYLGSELLRALAATERPAVRVASQEVVFGWSDERWAELTRAARPDDRLTRERVRDETHESMLFPAAYRGLQLLFADSSARRARELGPLEIDALYRGLATDYGAEVVPPEPLLRQVVEDFLLEGRGAQAGAWLARYVAAYGAPTDLVELEARVKDVTALGDPGETVAGLLAEPRATPEAMRAHLGTWTGSTWRGSGRREPLRVRFWVEDGRVRGEVAHEQGPVMEVEYLHVRTDGGLEFGFKNGMRPRGLITYMEASAGGDLEGAIEFRGMRFVPPPGESFPTPRFELARAPEK